MAYVGYPTGSAQAPQSGLPGGALVPYGTGPLTSGLGAPGVEAGQDPRFFQELLNKLKGAGRAAGEAAASPRGQMVAGLGLPAAYAAGSLMQGDIAKAAGEIGGGVAGTAAAGNIARGLEAAGGTRGKLLGAGVRAAGGLLGGGIGGGIAGQVAQAAGTGIQNIASAVTGQQREEGKSAGLVPGTGVGVGLSNLSAEQRQLVELMRLSGVQIPTEQARAMLPLINQMKDSDVQRQMQLNQQLGQLTGALNRQQYAFQLAGGAQAQAGETLRSLGTSNPYAASTFRY